jgi:hypothetical protein
MAMMGGKSISLTGSNSHTLLTLLLVGWKQKGQNEKLHFFCIENTECPSFSTPVKDPIS